MWLFLVSDRVANSRVRVGSGYENLGYGSGTGITLHLEPGYRVPSGSIRVLESSENLSKMTPLRRFYCIHVTNFFERKKYK